MAKYKGLERALIVRQPWLDMILEGKKIWEMRSKPTKIRGRVGLIEQGKGLIIGETNITGCSLIPVTPLEAKLTWDAHRVGDLELIKKWPYPWFMAGTQRYKKPIPYEHPRGAVTWVKLNKRG